jgi:hypothetical protein
MGRDNKFGGKFSCRFLFAGALLALISTVAQPAKDLITLDEFMNATDAEEARLSPDGSAAVIATESPDWQHNRFRSDLWIWKQKTGETIPLTRSRHARAPRWSPGEDDHQLQPDLYEPARPEWKPFQWKADDGTTVEGVLIYPPHLVLVQARTYWKASTHW